jgi:hypothetical protein
MLRAMWKVSFIKIDDEEDKALQDIILKRNEEYLVSKSNFFPFSDCQHNKIKQKFSNHYLMKSENILKLANESGSSLIKHEMAIEAALCDILTKDNNTIFGKWDYISHQVIASPFKPIDYMDKMDIFGYKYIEGFKTISKYLVIEIKKDGAQEPVIDQIMKYVDWINSEYAHGDYSMIEAYIVASDFNNNVIKKKESDCIRNFTKGYRPSTAEIWNNCNLVKYKYENGKLKFEKIIL